MPPFCHITASMATSASTRVSCGDAGTSRERPPLVLNPLDVAVATPFFSPHLKPAIAFLPGEVEVRDEEGGHHVSGVVVHPARQPQLPHGGVHQGVPCPPPLPGLQVMAVGAPPQSLKTPPDGKNFVNDVLFLFFFFSAVSTLYGGLRGSQGRSGNSVSCQ